MRTCRLKCIVFNAENLFLLSDFHWDGDIQKITEREWQELNRSTPQRNKELYKLNAIKEMIFKEDPDLILLCEVGGYESLANFNRLFLTSRYEVALIEGNSNRGIDVGYLIKKNLQFRLQLESYKDRDIKLIYPHEGLRSKPYFFSRDVSELSIYKNSSQTPFLVFFLVHLKSRLDPERIDPNGFERRKAEVKALIEIYKERRQKWGADCSMVIAGDFNGNASSANSDEEFAPIHSCGDFKDIFELAQTPTEQRGSFLAMPRGQKLDLKQIDFVFLNSAAQSLLQLESVQTLRFRTPRGTDLPQNLDEKLSLASDHIPLVFTLQIPFE